MDLVAALPRSPLEIGLFALAIATIFVAGAVSRRTKTRRATRLAALAEELGLLFYPQGWGEVPGFSDELELFRRGKDYRARNVMTGVRRNTPVQIFDCSFHEAQTGRRSGHHTRTIISLEWPAHFPAIIIEPEGRVAQALGRGRGSNIGFESAEFNRHFRVRCEDARFAHDVVHARTMELLLHAREAMPDLHVQIAGERGLFFRERTLPARLIRPLLDFAADFNALIPDYVKKDYART